MCSESLYEDEEFDMHQRQLAALLVSKVRSGVCLLKWCLVTHDIWYIYVSGEMCNCYTERMMVVFPFDNSC